MTSYRIEIVPASEGMFAVEAYGDADRKIGTSGPIFHSEQEANAGIEAMFDMAWPAKDPFAVDASIGV